MVRSRGDKRVWGKGREGLGMRMGGVGGSGDFGRGFFWGFLGLRLGFGKGE